jgi:hypothetical protein
MVHKAADGPVGYMVFGASCNIEILVGNGESRRRTTKERSSRRAEMLLAHGDALLTRVPLEGDAPIEVSFPIRSTWHLLSDLLHRFE